jgi:glycosyltransferase involved in cell wall biosynthesis
VKKSLRILILTPTTLPEISGNAITAERWRQSLVKKGLSVRALATEYLGADNLFRCLDNVKPDVVHAHHVSRAGALILDPLIRECFAKLPLVVSPAGTDLFSWEGQSYDRGTIVAQVCRRACIIITQGDWTAKRLSTLFPDEKGRILHVPKAFSWFGNDSFDLRKSAGWSPEHFVFFLPAGIRPVKRNLETLRAIEKVHHIRSHVRIFFAGPGLDQEYTALFQEELDRLSAFARWIPVIPHGAMHSAYASADVVINASSSEGLSNALLEAIAAGRPILASDIPGNRWPVAGGRKAVPCGMLFNLSDNNDFVRQALKLIDDGELRNQLSQAGKDRAATWPGPEEEADGLIRAYEEAIERQRERTYTVNRI